MSNCVKFLTAYLESIGIINAQVIEERDAEFGRIIIVTIPKGNNQRIGVLLGKDGSNLTLLKRLLNRIGLLEGDKPLLITKKV